jgi:hypothetical protein
MENDKNTFEKKKNTQSIGNEYLENNKDGNDNLKQVNNFY